MKTWNAIAVAAAAALSPLVAQAADITLPAGFRATVVFDGAGPARHMAVDQRGDIYVSNQLPRNAPPGTKPPGILALRDTDGDGKFDEVKRFGDLEGTGIRFHGGDLYATNASTLYRYRFSGGDLVPSSPPDVIVSGIPASGFGARAVAFDDRNGVYVAIGGGGNTCTDKPGPTGKPVDPCPDLVDRAGIWRYDAGKVGQTHPADGEHFATGVRDMQAMDWDPADHALYAVMQGRNGINNAGAKLFTAADSAQGVAEEMHRVVKGTNFGWPYTHFDGRTMQRLKAPEYGGKPGDVVTDARYDTPLAAFPSHSSPLDIAFYDGKQFPAQYRGGAFVVFQGGSEGDGQHNGYNVWFVPKPPAKGFAKPVVFADGFAGAKRNPQEAENRPSSVAVAPNGALYVMDSKSGRIWRIDYVGGAAAGKTVAAR
jgi:glucose/arabinose dehydrogenase